MPTRARLETVLTGDDSPFVQAVNRAEKRAESFSGRVKNLFRRDPGQRAEHALSGFITDLSAGNVQGAIASISNRISGFGLLAGVAIGVAAETFIRFRRETQDADKSVAHLAETLGTFTSAGRAPEALAKHFQEVSAAVQDSLEKTERFGNKVARFAEEFLQPLPTRARRGPEQDAAIRAGLDEEIETLKRRGAAELENQRIQTAGLTISQEQAQLEKIEADAAEKRAQISDEQKNALADIAKLAKAGILPEGRAPELYSVVNESAKARTEAVDRAEQTALVTAQQSFEIKNRELAVEQDLADMALQGASAEEQKEARLKSQLGLIQDQLNFDRQLTREEAAQLRIRETQAKTALRSEQMKEFFKTPAQRNQEQVQQKQQEQRTRQFDKAGGMLNPHYDKDGNLIGGTDPVTGKHVNMGEGRGTLDQTYTTSSDAYDVAPQRGRAYESQLEDVDWHMPEPERMQPFGGSEDFNRWFHRDEPETPTVQPDQGGKDTALADLNRTVTDGFNWMKANIVSG